MPRSSGHLRYVVLGWYCLLAMLAYVHRSCLSVPQKRIETELGIDPMDMAWILSMFFWGYAIAQLPSGFLGDRFGCRYVVPVLESFFVKDRAELAPIEAWQETESPSELVAKVIGDAANKTLAVADQLWSVFLLR